MSELQFNWNWPKIECAVEHVVDQTRFNCAYSGQDPDQAYERDIAAAKAAAQSTVAASHEGSMREVAEKLAALNADLDAKTADAEAAIAARRDTAMNDIDSLARSMGDEIVSRLLGGHATVGAA